MEQLEISGNPIAQQLNHAVDLTLEKRPALESVVKPFAAVLIKRARLIEELMDHVPPMDMDYADNRLDYGVPVVTSISLGTLKNSLETAFTNLLPVLKNSFPNQDDDFTAIGKSVDRGEYDLSILAQAYLEGNYTFFQSTGQKTGGSEGALEFVVNWAPSTVLNAARIQWMEPDGTVSWSKGYCPFCGSLPGIASLAKPSGPASDFSLGGGGQKYLHCALCGHQWRFERNRCPVCDTDEKDHLVYYQEAGETGERIDACRKCGRYLLCIDLRKRSASPCMDLAALGMVHLDVLAQDKGYRPMRWMPWNRIDLP